MKIDALQSFIPKMDSLNAPDKSKGDDFKNVLTEFLGKVNQSQLNADDVTNQFVQGGNVQIQDVMIAGEQAKTSLELLMEIRNKALDMYNQLTNIPV
jgi:flagellar hook-basal body complex protein FliE